MRFWSNQPPEQRKNPNRSSVAELVTGNTGVTQELVHQGDVLGDESMVPVTEHVSELTVGV